MRKRIDLKNGTCEFIDDFLEGERLVRLTQDLKKEIELRRQDFITVWANTYPVPRLQQWYADDGITYTWSGIKMCPAAWTPALLEVKSRVELTLGQEFNSVLVNFYRDGADCVGWHSDDESELGENPIIASLSLGGTRDFVLREKNDHKSKMKIPLTDGSLFVMSGETQKNWQHTLPKRKTAAPRINLTFRKTMKK